MLNPGQIRGMLLEEVVLHLLRSSGYLTVDDIGTDQTLASGSSGLEVRGRGEKHQIDAIADFVVPQPFGYPARLLLEAKFTKEKTGIDVIRNAVGVLKDVSEFFVPPTSKDEVLVRRYHYQMAVVSASGFTSGAQRYAYAHDIDLIPLQSSAFFNPIRAAIQNIDDRKVQELRTDKITLRSLRKGFRKALRGSNHQEKLIQDVVSATRVIDGAYLAIAGRRLRLFLVPQSADVIKDLPAHIEVEIREHGGNWLIEKGEKKLFSFELPDEVSNLYSVEARHQPGWALGIKEDFLREIHIYAQSRGQFRIVRLLLDRDWLDRAKRSLANEEKETITID